MDVAFGDPVVGEPELATAKDTLGFAGIAPPTVRLYPIATHVAEKLHAYTMPRRRPNTRVKDLPDLALLAGITRLDADQLRTALAQTFSFRKTHPLPPSLPDPNPAWQMPYVSMAKTDQLTWLTLEEVTAAAKAFLDPVLSGDSIARWDPDTWSWRR